MRLAAEGLSVRIGGTAVIADAALSIGAGTVTALIGANGAGKSTLLRALAGLLPADGTVRLNGRPAGRAALRGAVAYMPQDTSATSSLTLLEVVLLGRLGSLGLRVPRPLVEAAGAELGRFGLGGLGTRSLDAVSGGQRQLAYLAQALFREPRVLLLDEPTAALDLRHQLIVLDAVRATAAADGIAVMMAMHDLSLAAQVADRFLCLRAGRIQSAGSASEVLVPDRLRDLYGVEAEVILSPQGRTIVLPLRAIPAAGPD